MIKEIKLKYIFIFLLGIIISVLYFNINPSDVNFLPKCPLYATTGLYCPGCGSQRATHELLHLHFLQAAKQNILFLIGIALFIYHYAVLGINKIFNKSWNSLLNYPKTPIIILIVVLIYWILRNIPIEPFKWLSPH